jgi:hypothetical protein
MQTDTNIQHVAGSQSDTLLGVSETMTLWPITQIRRTVYTSEVAPARLLWGFINFSLCISLTEACRNIFKKVTAKYAMKYLKCLNMRLTEGEDPNSRFVVWFSWHYICNIFVNAPYFDTFTHRLGRVVVCLGGHPAKYWSPTNVRAVCFLCVYCFVWYLL